MAQRETHSAGPSRVSCNGVSLQLLKMPRKQSADRVMQYLTTFIQHTMTRTTTSYTLHYEWNMPGRVNKGTIAGLRQLHQGWTMLKSEASNVRAWFGYTWLSKGVAFVTSDYGVDLHPPTTQGYLHGLTQCAPLMVDPITLDISYFTCFHHGCEQAWSDNQNFSDTTSHITNKN